ncbi:MAG: hypothetical protein RBR97_13820 [Bacteroidales bacterium]|nr:hypothetical protein [Bacteroidales bacterium]
MTQYTLKKSSLKASFNGYDYKFSKKNNLKYTVVVCDNFIDLCAFEIEYMHFGYGEKHFEIIRNDNLEIPQIVYDSMDEISEFLKKVNFEREFLEG